VIKPYGNFSISPAASCFHYGLECFEGMKAYKNEAGETLMFRPGKFSVFKRTSDFLLCGISVDFQ